MLLTKTSVRRVKVSAFRVDGRSPERKVITKRENTARTSIFVRQVFKHNRAPSHASVSFTESVGFRVVVKIIEHLMRNTKFIQEVVKKTTLEFFITPVLLRFFRISLFSPLPSSLLIELSVCFFFIKAIRIYTQGPSISVSLSRNYKNCDPRVRCWVGGR